MSKQNAEVLASTARSEASLIANGDKRTISAIIANWNECVKQAGFMCVYDFPTTGYTRKSQLVADLERCAAQLDDYVEPSNYMATATAEQCKADMDAILSGKLTEDHKAQIDFFAANDHAARCELIELAHSEALEENKRFNWLANRWGLFWAGSDYFTRRTMIEEAHDEAQRIDAEQYAAQVTCSIFQRNDGVQLALDNSCDVRFIRTSKNGEWFKAGFRNTGMEGYQPVEHNVLFTVIPSRTVSFSDGAMVISEA